MLMVTRKFDSIVACACAVGLAMAQVAPVTAQSVLAYPAQGQTAEQTRKDELECQMWAMDRTGFNPRSAPPQTVSSYGSSYGSGTDSGGFGSGETGQGGVVRDGARGAAIGAIGGAIAGDAGKGAAWGALGGAVFGGMKRGRRRQQEADWESRQQQQLAQQQQQQQQQYQQGRQNFNGAFGLCMESRNYKVQY